MSRAFFIQTRSKLLFRGRQCAHPVPRRGGGWLRAPILVGAFAALIVAACKEDGPTEPQVGALSVSISTLGGDPDIDGYVVVVDSERQNVANDRPSRGVPGLSGFLFVNGISAGTHLLSLEGVADNCTVVGKQPQSITVAPGSTAQVAFNVTCDATGIGITTRTTGADEPYDGYPVKSGERSGGVPPNGNFVMSRLRPGTHTVALTAPENCSVTGGTSVTVNVVNRAVTPVTFEITCARTEKRIAFAGSTQFSSSIFVADGNGASIVALAAGSGPTWSPDGARLLYSDAECDFYYGCYGGLVLMDPDTRSWTTLSNGRLGIDPSWSPDGKLIAFSRIPDKSPATLELAGLDGSPAVQLNTPGITPRHPSWSPDGQRIVFECSFGPSSSFHEICIINRDGTELLRLTSDAFADNDPAWSPDGSRIAFGTTRFGPQTHIAFMTPSGTGITQLTNGFAPAWSSDGSRLVFARDDGLFTINSDGSNVTRLTTGKHYVPSWRP